MADSKAAALARQVARTQDNGVNVQVILRCRPATSEEVAHNVPQVVLCNEPTREVTLYQQVGGKQLGRTFHFDKVFGSESGQERLYGQAIYPIVQEVLDGFNCTIFAYGQTGTGKTYTMEGGDRNSADGSNMSDVAGVIPRAIHHIFTHLDSINSDYTVKCSFLELYNEETTDLLAVGDSAGKLRIMEDRSGVVVQGLEEIIVKTSTDIFSLLDRGSAKRKTAATLLNKQSSRSHSVFCVTVHMRELQADGEEVIKIGKLYLVDLAGSENISRSGATDARAKEAGLINKSLLTLGRVITALVENSGHVPYRDSKLTRLLRDSLGGRTKTCIIATIAPTVQCQEETLSTLDYAHRAKNIRNRPEVNQKVTKTAHIKEMGEEIDRLKAELHCTREKNGVFMPKDLFEAREAECKAMAAQVEAVQGGMEVMREEQRLREHAAQCRLDAMQQEVEAVQEALALARQGLEERDFLIAAHERSEAALSGHASALAGTLSTATADIGALFAKVDQTTALEAANAAVVAELYTEAKARLQALEAVVAGAVAAQRERSGEVGRAMAQLLRQKEGDLATLRQQSAALQAALASLTDTVSGSLTTTSSAANSGLQALQELHVNHATAAGEAAAQAMTALEAAYSALTNSMHTSSQQLHAFTQQQGSAAEAALAAARSMASAAQTNLVNSASAASTCQSAAGTALREQTAALASFEAKFKEDMSRDQADLLSTVAGMLSSFAARRTEEVAGAVAGMQSRLAERNGEVSTYHDQLGATLSGGCKQLQAAEEALVAQAADDAKQSQAHEAGLVQELQICSTAGVSVKAAADHAASAAAAQLADHMRRCASAAAQAEAAVQSAAGTGSQACGAAVEAVSSGQVQLLETAAACHAVDGATITMVTDAAGQGDSAAAAFGATHAEQVQQLTAQLTDSTRCKFVSGVSTDDLPERTRIEVPSQEWLSSMCVPAHSIILEEFHRQKEAAASPSQAAAQAPHAPPSLPALDVAGADDVDGTAESRQPGPSSPNKRKASRDPSPERVALEHVSPNKPSRLRTTFETFSRQA